MLISVIIPVRDEAEHIAQTLDMLLAQENPLSNGGGYEFLVVDGMSTDKTKEIVQSYCGKYPNVKYFENPKKLSSAARNIGVKNAEGKYVLIVDGHCIISSKEMLANAVKAFETNHSSAEGNAEVNNSLPDILARPQPQELKDATTLQIAVAAARRSKLGHNPDSFIYSGQAQWCPASSAGIAYRKEVFEQVGYFDETFDACEDVEFNTRCDKAGLKCWFEPAVAVSYVPRNSLTGLFYQMMRYGKGRVKLFRKHPETFSLTMFGLGMFVGGIIAGWALFFISFILFNVICIYFAKERGFTVSPTGLSFGFFWINGEYAEKFTHPLFDIIISEYLAVLLVSTIYVAAVCLESLRLALRLPSLIRYLPNLPMVFFALHFGFGWGILRELFCGKRYDKMS